MPVRRIDSLEDAIKVLRDLDNRLAVYESTNIDFHGRRIQNASPSKEQNDYVVRRELLAEIAAVQRPSSTTTSQSSWKIKFVLEKTIANGTNVLDVPYRLDELSSGNTISLKSAGGICKIPPNSGDFIARVIWSNNLGVSWLDLCTITILQGTFQSVQIFTADMTITSLSPNDWLDINIIQSGGDTSNVEIGLGGEISST